MKQNFENCFQCVSYKKCFAEKSSIELTDARERAEACDKPFKGLGTDLVNITGTAKCLSLKKALRYSQEGRVEWVDFHRVRFVNELMG